MAKRVGINGFGRIGRHFLRASIGTDKYEIVAINDLTDAKTLAHLLAYDSVHGRFHSDVQVIEGRDLAVNGKTIEVLSQRDPAQLPWSELGVDVVLESTGLFTDCATCCPHIDAGAKKVVISAPAKGPDITIVMGVNDKDYDPDKHNIISNASCTTNCLAPIAKILLENYGIVKGFMTTIHSFTNDQKILDLPHKDLRRARSATLSMIPTTTGAAKAVSLVLPQLKGKLDGMAIRVPTPNVSIVDLVVELGKNVTAEEVNRALKDASQGSLKGYLGICEEPLVSIDFNENPLSSIVDSAYTSVIGGNMVKILSWYDNEWGYSNRLRDLIEMIA